MTLYRIFFSYFYRVEFRDFFIADELNSLAYSIWTFSYFTCAYVWDPSINNTQCDMSVTWTAPLLASIPPWWRLLQCIRRYQDSNERVHLVNGLKYVSSIVASIMTGVRRMYPGATMDVIWITVSVINSCYTIAWDLKMDWGLLQLNSRNYLLRDELVFDSWTYFVAMVTNIALRLIWIINISGLSLDPRLIGFIIALLEACRRIQWNLFRLENEHINNCGQFRAIKEIPLPFVLSDTVHTTDEESSILLPIDDPYLNDTSFMIPSTRQSSIYHSNYYGSTSGSFYGRRDFESRQDKEAEKDGTSRPPLQNCPSMIESVLLRFQSKSASDASD
ncbi:EXS family-domain-containing protein [Spinellus fusiger]|nr:EXS family-domain-containing protein [Spinellus fusiger]